MPLVATAVFACYRFQWWGLRYLTSEVVLRFAGFRGYPTERLGPDLISWNNGLYHFGIACTFADVFCGAIPLVWMWSVGVFRNLANLTVFAVVLFAFNVLRLYLTDLVFTAGASWLVADQVIGGAAYFAVWVCLMKWIEFHCEPEPAAP
jgi:hypothetical protein